MSNFYWTDIMRLVILIYPIKLKQCLISIIIPPVRFQIKDLFPFLRSADSLRASSLFV